MGGIVEAGVSPKPHLRQMKACEPNFLIFVIMVEKVNRSKNEYDIYVQGLD